RQHYRREHPHTDLLTPPPGRDTRCPHRPTSSGAITSRCTTTKPWHGRDFPFEPENFREMFAGSYCRLGHPGAGASVLGVEVSGIGLGQAVDEEEDFPKRMDRANDRPRHLIPRRHRTPILGVLRPPDDLIPGDFLPNWQERVQAQLDTFHAILVLKGP